jgi:hypothetical protein
MWRIIYWSNFTLILEFSKTFSLENFGLFIERGTKKKRDHNSNQSRPKSRHKPNMQLFMLFYFLVRFRVKVKIIRNLLSHNFSINTFSKVTFIIFHIKYVKFLIKSNRVLFYLEMVSLCLPSSPLFSLLLLQFLVLIIYTLARADLASPKGVN